MGGMCKSPSAPRCDQLPCYAVFAAFFIPGVVMQVSGKDSDNLDVFLLFTMVIFFPIKYIFNKKFNAVMGVVFFIQGLIDPRGFGCTKDDFCPRFDMVINDIPEIT